MVQYRSRRFTTNESLQEGFKDLAVEVLTETPLSTQAQPEPPTEQYLPSELLHEGLSLCGFSESRQTRVKVERNEDRFRGNFGVSSLAISKLVTDLLDGNNIRGFNLRYFFLTLFWLKAYPTYVQIEGPWNLLPETIGPKIKEYARCIQLLKEKKIKWFEDDEIADDIFIITVDGVHCRVQEVRKDPGTKWYSHKSHGAALGYELGIAIRSDRLVWINGPFPASRHDITIYKYGSGTEDSPQRNLKSMIPKGKRAIADSGYAGEDNNTISVSREGDSDEVK